MQLHQLKPIHKLKKKKRIGRGGKRGTFSGRGVKGQKSRSGTKFQPAIRESIKKYPKLRGYRFKGKESDIIVVNIWTLDQKFKEKEVVSPQSLIEKKIIRKIKGKIPKVKILGKGELTKPLIIENCGLSKSAKEKVEKAKGTVKIFNS